jgi:hypothetical protein
VANVIKGNKAGPGAFIQARKGNKSAKAGTLNAGGALQHRGGFPSIIGALQGICLNDVTSVGGDTFFGRHLQVGVLESVVIGNPGPPSLILAIPGMWRFRWSLKPGPHSITINALQGQPVPVSGTTPTLTVKANPLVGINADVSAAATPSNVWVTIGPVFVIATATGPVWVELRNNYWGFYNTPAFFDHVIFT